MGAPSKGHNFQRVQIPPTQSRASGVERIYAAEEVMNLSKPCRRMQQAATQVNVLSPVMSNVTEADAFHYVGRQHLRSRNWQEGADSVGILGSGMLQDGKGVNLGDPLRASILQGKEYLQTSQSRRGCRDHVAEVGSAGSTPSAGKPRAWGSGRRGEASGNVIGIHASQRAK
jgi:hypothetical protein